MQTEFLLGVLEGCHLDEQQGDERIILKWISEK